MQYFYSNEISGNSIVLNMEESAHATRVLRKKLGDQIHVLDGKGYCYIAEIKEVSKQVKANIVSAYKQEKQPKIQIHLAVSPTKKADKMEWMVEKLTEIGVHKISFIQSENGERSRINADRLNKKALAAMKQSGNLWLPMIETDVKFSSFLKSENSKHKYMAHCYDLDKQQISDSQVSNESVCVMIGPEGDFSRRELDLAVEAGFSPLSLGIPRYRTETAAIVACTLINHFCVTLK